MSDKAVLLLLETATGVCSVALSEGEHLLAMRTSKEEREHASMLANYIDEVMTEARKNLNEISAVVVSKGPGSYTGLRIGVATAKGICFSLQKPLIAIDTPLAMASSYLQANEERLPPDAILVPVIDARRMEVYGAAFDRQLNYVERIQAEILTPSSFIQNKQLPHFIFGDAASKCAEVFKSESYVKVDSTFNLSAQGLLYPGLHALNHGIVENIASFEPYYLKEFVAKVKQVSG